MTFTLGAPRQQLGQILVDMRLISEVELDEALMEQKVAGQKERLGALLLRRGLISASDYLRALARQHRLIAVAR